jgi:glucose/arabinose dehydrogenase
VETASGGCKQVFSEAPSQLLRCGRVPQLRKLQSRLQQHDRVGDFRIAGAAKARDPDPKFAMGHKCSEFTPPVFKLGAHMAPLGMKFYTGNQFPAEYKDSIEHGSWNRLQYQGARLVRINVDPDGKNTKQEVFASGWLAPDNKYLGRPNDVLMAKDGSLLVADDYNGAIYRISYSK